MTVGDRPNTRDDLWTLLAIAYAGWDGRGVDARSIPGLGRAIRRAVLADEAALRASLGRLVEAGLLVESGGSHRAAAPVAAFLRERTHRRGIWHDFRDLGRHLGLEGF
jgi:hypothetical protein